MGKQYKKSFLGGLVALILGTSCCWLSAFAFWFGGATFLTVSANFFDQNSGVILGVALLFFLLAFYQFWKHKKGKRITPLVLLLILPAFTAFSQKELNHKEQIIGKWRTHDNRAIVEIYEQDDTYFGKLVWLENATNHLGEPRKDVHNPIKTNHRFDLLELTIMDGFSFKKNSFVGGTLYDPDTGSLYNCKLWLKDEDHLMVRDYCGVFYMTFEWERVE